MRIRLGAGKKDGQEDGPGLKSDGRPGNSWNLRQWIKGKGLEKWFTRDNLIILALSGVLLFIIALPMDGGSSKGEGQAGAASGGMEELFDMAEAGGVSEGEELAETWEEQILSGGITDEEYAAYLEQRLTQVLAQVAGVGQVRVMITLSSSRELVVEREQPITRSATNEADSQGGTRVINQVETGDSVVYSSNGSSSDPYVVKILPPQIEGVLVVAEGAGDINTNRTIVIIVQALFDVESHKISVVRMETK